jgi:hypothetical protein
MKRWKLMSQEKIDMKRPLAMATLHFLALVDVLESIGEQALHGTGRRWSLLTTNSVASSLREKVLTVFVHDS